MGGGAGCTWVFVRGTDIRTGSREALKGLRRRRRHCAEVRGRGGTNERALWEAGSVVFYIYNSIVIFTMIRLFASLFSQVHARLSLVSTFRAKHETCLPIKVRRSAAHLHSDGAEAAV